MLPQGIIKLFFVSSFILRIFAAVFKSQKAVCKKSIAIRSEVVLPIDHGEFENRPWELMGFTRS